jgi:hypothetical protein
MEKIILFNKKRLFKPKKRIQYFIKKINEQKEKISNFPKKKEYLFEDPNTFLILPNESNFKFIINKKPIGPRYNENHKLIPYSIIGTPKQMSHKTTMNKSLSIRSKMSINQKLNHNYNNYFTSRDYKEVTDKDIRNIFNRLKDNIYCNIRKEKSEINKREKDVKKDLISKQLKIQEKSLKNNKLYLTQDKKIHMKIQRQIDLYLRRKKLNTFNSSNLSSNFIMDSANNYFFKKEAKTLTEANKNIETINKKYYNKISSYDEKKNDKNYYTNPNVKWEMSLRRPKHFNGVIKKVLNIHTPEHPYWFISTERSPKSKEVIVDSRFSTVQNIDNKEHKYFEDVNTLNIKGEKLIDFEENLCKKLKGKKKLFKYKYEDKYLKDLNIVTNYYLRGRSLYNSSKEINNKKII